MWCPVRASRVSSLGELLMSGRPTRYRYDQIKLGNKEFAMRANELTVNIYQLVINARLVLHCDM